MKKVKSKDRNFIQHIFSICECWNMQNCSNFLVHVYAILFGLLLLGAVAVGMYLGYITTFTTKAF